MSGVAAFRRWNAVFCSLLVLLIARLWLMPIASSFWIDEMATAFVVRHGGSHPSFAIAPQVPQSAYYIFPWIMEKLFGLSEVSYRIPSILFMGVALYLVARLAARLIHPQAAWFAVFACLALRGIDYHAADARPYAMATALLAACFLFLVYWLDSARWWHAAGFILSGALLLHVHLLLWPSYFVFGIYTVFRVTRRETPVRWPVAIGVFTVLALTLIPAVLNALMLLRDAGKHSFAEMPRWRNLRYALKPGLIVACGAGAALYMIVTRRAREVWSSERWVSVSSLCLFLAWWLFQPLGLYALSHATGNSVFVARYMSAALPGCALVATAVARRLLPGDSWRPATLLLGVGVLVFIGDWRDRFPRHDFSDWRAAVQLLHRTVKQPDTPVLCPSPFIEAQPPVWRPDYPLPGFLYAHLDIYRIPGKAYLFPYVTVPYAAPPEAERYAKTLTRTTLLRSDQFLIYGGDRAVEFWRDWLLEQPELDNWRSQQLGLFGNIEVILFERASSKSDSQLSSR